VSNEIAVIGGGNGAHAVAAELALAGNQVRMFEFPKFKETFAPVLDSREIIKEGVGVTGRAQLKTVTIDMEEAIEGAKYIFIVLPAFAHTMVAESLAPYLQDGQILILLPGSAGTLRIKKILDEKGINKDITLVEGSTLPYGARLIKPGHVAIFVEAVLLPVGVFPAKKTDEVISELKTFYPSIKPAKDVLEAMINNPNPYVHPAASLLSATRIEYSKGEFYLYVEGVTPSTARLFEALNRERLTLCKAMNWRLYHWDNLKFEEYDLGRSQEECYKKILNTSMDAFFGKNSIQAGMKMLGPKAMKDRYITEDVPYGLVLIKDIGSLMGIEMPLHESMIRMCSAINEEDYEAIGLTTKKIGISGMEQKELEDFLYKG